MKAFKYLSVACVSMGLAGCAAMAQMQQDWIAQYCVDSAAYNKGLSDGLTCGVKPNPDYAAQCPTNNNELNTAYLTGFMKGMRARPKQTTINNNVNVGVTNRFTKAKKLQPANPFPSYSEPDWMPKVPEMPQ